MRYNNLKMPDSATRRNPDDLLAAIQVEEQRAARGKLLVFLGYAAGVGKTYAMLQAAQQRRAEGVDLVVGYVETHGRAETDALLNGCLLYTSPLAGCCRRSASPGWIA